MCAVVEDEEAHIRTTHVLLVKPMRPCLDVVYATPAKLFQYAQSGGSWWIV